MLFLLFTVVGWALLIVLTIVLTIWPAVVGILAGAWLWKLGHDNVGALIGLGGLVAQVLWLRWWLGRSEGPVESYSDKTVKEYLADILEEIREKLSR